MGQRALGLGDHAVAVAPAYQLLTDLPRSTGATVTEVALRRQDGFGLDVQRIAAAVRPTTRLTSRTPPQPDGALSTAGELLELVDIAERTGVQCWLGR